MKNIIFLMSVILIGCGKEVEVDTKDKNGIIISKNSLWSASVTDDDSLSNKYFLARPTIYQDNVLLKTRKNRGNVIRMINLTHGETKWEWNDWLAKNVFDGSSIQYVQNNKLTFQTDYENYQINLDNGKTIWKNAFSENYSYWCIGLGDIFVSKHLTNRYTTVERGGGYVVIMSNIDGKPLYKFKPSYAPETTSFEDGGWAYFGNSVPFINNGDTMVLVRFNDSQNADRTSQELLSLYNLSRQKWVYERQKLKSFDTNTTSPHPSFIYKENVYHLGLDVIVCHDLMSGKKVWETKLPPQGNFFAFAGLIIENDKVYANSDGGQLFCLDAKSGKVNWQIRSSGSSTALSYLNGVVYFVGGGDGKLHAVDAETGEYLWKIESPDRGKNKSAIFSGLCAVVPGVGSEKGKIVVTTGLNAYCYEAIR